MSWLSIAYLFNTICLALCVVSNSKLRKENRRLREQNLFDFDKPGKP
jgi:hypothetical protein